MHAWEAIQNVINYIEENLSEDLAIEDMAKIAALSLFYFQRLFCRLVGKPVKEYVKLRRLAAASEALLMKHKRILDIAIENGFGGHETFTRAFKSAYAMTPEQFRTNPVRLNRFLKPELELNYVLIDENVPLITDSIVIEIKRSKLTSKETFIGITMEAPIETMASGETTGVDILGLAWDEFHTKKTTIPNLVPGGVELGASYYGKTEGHFTYFAGGHALSHEHFPGYTQFVLQEGEYITCCFEAENFEKLTSDAIYKALKYLYETWLPKHGLTTEAFSAEKYYETSPEATYMEIWVRAFALVEGEVPFYKKENE